MTKHVSIKAQMLIAFVGRHRGECIVNAAKAAGARGGTITLGKSLNDSKWMQALSLADVQQDIVYIVMAGEAAEVVAGVKAAASQDKKKLSGIVVVLDVPELFLRKQNATEISRPKATRSVKMESGFKLMTVIVNDGYGDDVMAAAKKAGATGGTILNARGTGTEEDVKFFGITLVPEKEMILIVADEAKVRPIVDAVSAIPTLSKPGGGILFNMNVEEFIVLGK